MSKLLKYLYSISLIFTINKCISQTDSVTNKKSHFYVSSSIGLPIYNSFNLTQYPSNASYWVNSKIKPIYNAGIEYSFKHFNIGLSTTYLQSEYTGRDFEYTVDSYSSHYYQIIAKYNMYQKVNYNILQLCLTAGIKFNITPKHFIYTNILIASNLLYQKKITNYYSTNQLGYDTTKYSLVKNGSSNQNYGKWPSFGLIIAYNYNLNSRIILDIKLSMQYFSANRNTNYDDYNQDGKLNGVSGYRASYFDYKNIFIAPSIGLKFRLK